MLAYQDGPIIDRDCKKQISATFQPTDATPNASRKFRSFMLTHQILPHFADLADL